MRWVLDSNVWIEAVAGMPHAARALAKAATHEWCGFSAISRLEVFGFPKLTPADEQRFQILLAQFHEVPVSAEVIDRAIQLRRRARIKTPDAIIAATALVEKSDLVTRNVTDFQNLPDLNVIDLANL